MYRISSSIMRIQVLCTPKFHNDFCQKILFLFFKKFFKRNNHCKFIHHKSYLKPFLSYPLCIVRREYFSIIFNVKKCALYSIKYGKTFAPWKALQRKKRSLLHFKKTKIAHTVQKRMAKLRFKIRTCKRTLMKHK